MNKYILDVSNKLNESPIIFKNKSQEAEGLDNLPDGAFFINEANNQTLNYNVQVNNYRYW